MQMLLLHRTNGKPLVVDIETIQSIGQTDDGMSAIVIDTISEDGVIIVEEDFEDILGMLQGGFGVDIVGLFKKGENN